jgi:hypothetical protein
MLKRNKIIFGIFAGMVLVLVLIIVIDSIHPFILPYYYGWKIGSKYQQFENAYFNYLKNDKCGGKTPQETYEMYVSTLKRGDIETASKYYWWDKQVKEQKRLEKLKQQGKLEKYIVDLPKWEEMKEVEYWSLDGKRYSWKWILKEDKKYYDEFLEKWDILPAGEYEREITFQLNKQANIWKIY